MVPFTAAKGAREPLASPQSSLQAGKSIPSLLSPPARRWKGRRILGCLVKWDLTFFDQDELPATHTLQRADSYTLRGRTSLFRESLLNDSL